MNSEILADAIVTYRHAMKLYEDGFIGFERGYVQMNMEGFASIKELGDIVITRRKHDSENPYEVSVTYRGVKFLTIGTVLEFDAIGINVL